MNVPPYTLVLGVDRRHLDQLAVTFPTWRRHKASLMQVPLVVFYDRDQLRREQVYEVIERPDAVCVGWPPEGTPPDHYGQPTDDKWTDPQRFKMLSGFVHVPAQYVRAPYWLKLDCDVVATGNDNWIDPSWFGQWPAIISHPWGFTKPPDQIQRLDAWAQEANVPLPLGPLGLVPVPGADRVSHPRIISWCAFFQTRFTLRCSELAGFPERCDLPVPSQDGFMWYCAQRYGFRVVRTSMKGERGWEQWHTWKNIQRRAQDVMG